jgi:hypothetical protein
VSIYKTKVFDRWAKKAGLKNIDLCEAVEEMQRGLYDADLGGYVLKKRIARRGQGKSGGFRTLIATNKGSKWFFIFGWPKNERSNIADNEAAALKKTASYLLSMTSGMLKCAEDNGEIIRIDGDA